MIDSEYPAPRELYALVYSPKRQRKRVPENCVQIVESESAARDAACPDEKRYPAKVVGPSRSSEGLMLYYLVNWLD